MRADEPAFLGAGDRRFEERGPGEAAEAGMRLAERAQDAGHGDGAMAELIGMIADDVTEAVRAFAFELVGPHRLGASRR